MTTQKQTARIRVTFDCNTYSGVAKPHLHRVLKKLWPIGRVKWKSRLQRVAWWYVQLCIKRGRVVAAIPEALLTTEALSNKDRVDLLVAAGTSTPRPLIPQVRKDIIEAAFVLGFKVLHMPRIGHPSLVTIAPNLWAHDSVYSQADRHLRQDAFLRHFSDYAFQAVKTFGADLAKAHNLAASNPNATWVARLHNTTADMILWREGLAAENSAPCKFPNVDAFHKAFRIPLSDWTDFDVANAHYGYGYDYICTEDRGRLVSNSIFAPQYAGGPFDIKIINILELAKICIVRFWIPVLRWK